MRSIQGGFGSAGSSRSLRNTYSAVGLGSTASERERRAQKPLPGELRDLPPDEILVSLDEGVCPWCDDPRTFSWIAQHLVKGHGFDLRELREYLVLPKRRAFASDQLREITARNARAREAHLNLSKTPQPKRHHLGAAAMAHQRRLAARNGKAHGIRLQAILQAKGPEWRRASALKAAAASAAVMTPEEHRRAGQKGGAIRGRQQAERSHCKNGHPFSPENTRLRPNGTRICRACSREWNKKYRTVVG